MASTAPNWMPVPKHRASRCGAAISLLFEPARWSIASRGTIGATTRRATAPGLRFETCEWIHKKEIAAICFDTWGCEVRPNESAEAYQPWHWIVIPMIGITMGEIFYLKDLADDCAKTRSTSFCFAGRR